MAGVLSPEATSVLLCSSALLRGMPAALSISDRFRLFGLGARQHSQISQGLVLGKQLILLGLPGFQLWLRHPET